VTGLLGTVLVLSREGITPSMSVPLYPQAAKDTGLPEAFGRETKELCGQYRHGGISKG